MAVDINLILNGSLKMTEKGRCLFALVNNKERSVAGWQES
jgi:hypothetical protein